MEAIQYQFDVTNIDPYVGGGSPLPGGWYLMAISNMECRANNNAASGHNLWCESSVLDGEFKGRKLYENLNLWHTNSTQAVEIAQKQLSSIGHAVGVLSGNDLTLLANKPMLVEVELTAPEPDKVNPNTGETVKGRGPQNRVIQRKPATPENVALYINGQSANSGVAPQFQQQQQAAQAQQAPAFAPAQAPAAPPAQAPAAPPAQQAPAFAPQAQAAAPTAAPAPNGAAGAPAVPPWQRK